MTIYPRRLLRHVTSHTCSVLSSFYTFIHLYSCFQQLLILILIMTPVNIIYHQGNQTKRKETCPELLKEGGLTRFSIPHPPFAAYRAGGLASHLWNERKGDGREAEMVPLLSLWALGSLLLVPAFALLCPQAWVTSQPQSCLAAARPYSGTWEPNSCHWKSLTLLPGPCPDLLSGSLPSPGAATWPSRSWRLSRENSSHKFMGCDKSHEQGNSRALDLGPGDSFQPGQFGRRGWAKPSWVTLQARSPGIAR